MNAEELRALQAPLKARYRDDPATARVAATAVGRLEADGVTCRIETGKAPVLAGLHRATGGTGEEACSGDMLLEALVACAGVTLKAVATAMSVPLRGGTVRADGVFDARGTLGVAKDAPVGLQDVRLHFDLETDAPPEKIAKLIELTERYCVIYQTLRHPPEIAMSFKAHGAGGVAD
ncbi:MAG TPA: OsmC family protein [bacterium]|nr:OsmC family protein [bacterium]